MVLIHLDGVHLARLLKVGMELDPEQDDIIQITGSIV
jgi:hypothetical protein